MGEAVAAFLRDVKADQIQKRKLVGIGGAVPRRTTRDQLRAVDKALHVVLGRGLDAFCEDDKTAADGSGCLHPPRTDGSGCLHPPRNDSGSGCLHPPVLLMCMDEAGPNWSSVWFLYFQRRAWLVAFRDIFHREWNDVKLALHSVGDLTD